MTVVEVFLFGTLRHPPLARAVFGRTVEVRPAVLAGWSVRRAAEGDWPVLVAGGAAEGGVARLDGGALERADWYEALFGYRRSRCVLADGTVAEVYRPEGDPAAAEGWSLSDWATSHGRTATLAARAAMQRLGEDPARVAKRITAIRRRAEARARAGDGPAGDVALLSSKRVHDAFYELLNQRWSVPLLDGSARHELDRTTLAGFDAAIVLPWDRVRDRVMLIRQFRAALAVRGERDPFSTEPVAGLIDPGETPEEAAHREAEEEGGLRIHALHSVGEGYPTPGGTTEYHFLFIGECDLPDGAGGIGGLDAEGEDIEATLVPAGRLVADAVAGRVRNAPLHLLALALDRMRR
ncbi:nudix-type nucleoside diphosphatase (YffH/AdpP family) [Hasllibacter halocynthiae]|uniref:ADP-ribose pyrophosphatase n=1 Tax=Hasllibacter halocynthiae TaxID=595589 RepID=A0A2T0X8M9_9RHOB|nr:NUDIX domain-containing protein [Hasllibacter halocynthiae]PRY95279.1 nudix-type nucleoside diphosphatase (YffH/AdpP family) [Hasllibacter halocynthiae]